MPDLGRCWWALKVKVSYANYWLASFMLKPTKLFLRAVQAWRRAASYWSESLKPLEPVEDTDTFQNMRKVK